MPKPKGKPKVRLNLAISTDLKATMDELVGCTDADSLTEVIRRAVNFYAWHIRESAQGGMFFLEKNGRKERIAYPHFFHCPPPPK